jgi:hypothetical protein
MKGGNTARYKHTNLQKKQQYKPLELYQTIIDKIKIGL